MANIRKISDNSYKITVSCGRDANNKQIRHYMTWKPDRPMTEKQMEKAVQKAAYEFEKQLELEKARHDAVTEEQIIEQLSRLADGDADDIVYRKSLIRLFVNKIFLYDDKFTITFNTGDDEVTITDKLLSEIEEGLNGKTVCFSKEGGHQQQADIPFGGCPPVVL